ncbi:gliding motility-associated C-terminal domain-containing protein [Saprospiraceae bacterium]|nr:gliding motility-associated C-terminal domain-containing protein [Saprospiraceae bacterium]
MKDLFGNWFTGKLSDFAGVIMIPFALKFLWNTKNSTAIFCSMLFFAFWKSPISQTLIEGLSSLSSLHFTRVVDFTDLIAFAVLPFVYWCLNNIEKISIKMPWSKIQKISEFAIMSVSIFAFIATSVEEPEIEFTPITSCCQNDPVIADVGSGKIFIPTIFTPDGNGLNDFFQIVADDNIARIDSFSIITDDAPFRIFWRTNVEDIIPENGFDGLVQGRQGASTFNYFVRVTSIDNVTLDFEGIVCSVPCFEDAILNRPENYYNCAFADQFDFVNGYNPDALPIEIQDCF